MKLIPQKWILEQIEVLTVGLPFCFFKLFCGLVLGQHSFKTLGFILIILSAFDFCINATNFMGLIGRKQRWWGACGLTILLGWIAKLRNKNSVENWQNLGTSLDVMLSFSLVATMVGAGGLKYLSTAQLHLWNICVVLNVLGAGLNRMADSVKQFSKS